MSKSLDIVKSRRQDSIIFTIFGIILLVWGLILFINENTYLGISVITLSFAVMIFAIATLRSASSTMEYRDLASLMTITMKKIDDLGRKLDEILKNLKKKKP